MEKGVTMQAIREIVTRDIFKNFDIPKEFGDEFEMILVPTKDTRIHYSGFLQNIALTKSEEIGNETKENEYFLAANYNSVIKEDEKEDEIWSKYL